MKKEKWAVIDIGSNTIRLVIYEKMNHASLKEAENIKTTARLRHYLTDEGTLNSEGVALLIEILQEFNEIIHFHKVEKIYCVATATIRQSKNQQEIKALVKEKTGLKMKIFSEEEEAFHGFYAVSRSTSIDTGITIDIGGGSTEVTYFENREMKHFYSFPFGVVSLKEQFMNGERITEDEKKQLTAFILQSFHQLPWLENVQVPVIAIGGSARNIAQIDQNLKKYPIAGIHQYVMSLIDLEQVQQYLQGQSISQLEKVEGLSRDRADIIVPAVEVFVQLCNFCSSSMFMFSRKGLRDGISMKKSDKSKKILSTDQIITNSISELMVDYHVDSLHAMHTGSLAAKLCAEISPFYKFHDIKELGKFIYFGSQIYYLGEYIDDDASSQHTFYLLANQSINGLMHKERVKLALIASFKNKTLLKQYLSGFGSWFSRDEIDDIRVGGAIAKVASALDSSKRSIVKKVTFEIIDQDSLLLVIYSNGKAFVEQYETEKHIRQLEKAINKNITLKFVRLDLKGEKELHHCR
ncbi:Ppx/GppA family phosphatase [Bacillus benzoevorans]|uniref:Exopolyphosphatase/guanosine-5'-triphosphate, 3'-diphosphate pyrophosphatase n=1 Tax=Bacillus benzoevorans TaxID=1456 RepID=A0A7X0LT88_9BACI|nr:Ppx/GppA family phosphatase [Bacillus benzoevorans]MBB6443666.1 exopolyphosphatase/guanosine-5'-triphosphate,3'-diphosphate pyrophosphatase [Bacillus benzoevorans]